MSAPPVRRAARRSAIEEPAAVRWLLILLTIGFLALFLLLTIWHEVQKVFGL